jgi:16S rRNA (cytosine1402-N4)-methyltransferase
LECLDEHGRVLGVDKDPAAQAVAEQLAGSEPRFTFFHGSFAELPHQLHRMGIDAVDGILLDLGVSSPQLDDGERGFSFQQDGPLDMRMDTTRGETAAQWLAVAGEQEIVGVLREYGEERFARRIAAAIVSEREQAPIETTGRLAKVVSEANPKWERHKHPVDGALDLLQVGGRLVVISFHSLEDRIVKRYMRDMARGRALPRGLPIPDIELDKRMKIVGKAVKAEPGEVADNPRARSAVMRVAEKIS